MRIKEIHFQMTTKALKKSEKSIYEQVLALLCNVFINMHS